MASRTVLKGRRNRAPCRTDLDIGCAARTSKSLSLSKSRPERSSKSDNVIWSQRGTSYATVYQFPAQNVPTAMHPQGGQT
jgi:hypothetical protein